MPWGRGESGSVGAGFRPGERDQAGGEAGAGGRRGEAGPAGGGAGASPGWKRGLGGTGPGGPSAVGILAGFGGLGCGVLTQASGSVGWMDRDGGSQPRIAGRAVRGWRLRPARGKSKRAGSGGSRRPTCQSGERAAAG